MKGTLLLLLTLIIISAGYAQEVKLKKSIYYVDNKPYMQRDCKVLNLAPCKFSSPDGSKLYFTTIPHPYTTPVGPSGGYMGGCYYQYKFVDSDKEFWTQIRAIEIIRRMSEEGVILPSGLVDKAKLELFIETHGLATIPAYLYAD